MKRFEFVDRHSNCVYVPLMRILMTGGSGLIGRETTSRLAAEGHSVSQLVRRAPKGDGEIAWTPGVELQPETLKDVDAIVNLAGRTVAGRWTDRAKAEIRESRIPSTAALARSIAASFKLYGTPATFLSASAIGYYGSRGDETLTEDSKPGHGFLCDVTREWEAATSAAREAGVRVVTPRIAVVLSPQGGALAKMLTPFRLGLGGHIGTGRQWWSWITLDDLVSVLTFAITDQRVQGAVNATSPSPVTNSEFTKALGQVLRRPAIFPVPASVARLIFSGGGAEEMLLSSQRVAPEKLRQLGFEFRDPELKSALKRMLD